jgi:hypothetical protein
MACSSKQQPFSTKVDDDDKGPKVRTCFICSPNEQFASKKLFDEHGCKNHVPFVCERCEKRPQFKTFHLYNSHHNLHHDESKQVECKECHKKFKSESELKYHQNTVHVAAAFVCVTCGKGFKLVHQLNQHQRVHTDEKPFECAVCGTKFSSNGALTKHTNRFHTAKETITCEFCEKTFDGTALYERHLELKHSEARKPKAFVCYVCGENFKDAGELNKHGHMAHKLSCSICGKKFKSFAPLNSHIRLLHQQDRRYVCDVCDFRFETKNQRDQHKQKVHVIPEYECELCAKLFKTAADLKTHMLVHDDENNFVCDICQMRFKFPVSLNKHKRVMHENERSYVCALCDETFTTSTTLFDHFQSVHENKFYKCTGCLLKFRSEDKLKRHHNNLHAEINKKCPHCSRSFKNRLAFTTHTAKRHTICPDCKLDCMCSTNRREHLDHDHPPECQECERKLKSRVGLSSHIFYKHRIFQCPMCDVKLGYQEMHNHRFGKFASHPHFFCSLCYRSLNGNESEHQKLIHSHCRYCSKEHENFMKVAECEKSHGKVRVKLEELLKECRPDLCEMSASSLFIERGERFSLRSELVSTMSGNVSIGKDSSSSSIEEEKFFSPTDSEIKLLGTTVAAFTISNLTQSVLEMHDPRKVTKSSRPKSYFVFEKSLQKGLERLKVNRLAHHHFGHLATSCYGHDAIDKVFRNTSYNLTMISEHLNKKQMFALEKWGLSRINVLANEGDFMHLAREILCIHDHASRHPLGQPLFVVEIFSYWFQDGTFELNIFVLPNVPLAKYFGFFEISCWQFEAVFGKKLLTSATADEKVFRNMADHERKTKIRHNTITTDQLQTLVTLTREQLSQHHLVVDEDIAIETEEAEDIAIEAEADEEENIFDENEP